MSLKKIATKQVVTVAAQDSIQDAALRMRDQHVGDVVVVENDGGVLRPVGILTDRDIVLSIVAFGIAPSSVTVGEVMTPSPVTARATDSYYHLLDLMKENGIRRVPLVDDEGSLAGIVSTDDVVSILAAELEDIVAAGERQRRLENERRKKLA